MGFVAGQRWNARVLTIESSLKTLASAPLSEDDDLLLDNQLSFALYTASNRIARIYNAILKEFDLTFPQLLCLMALWKQSPLMVGDFSRKLELDNGSITPLLKRLEMQGFVKRTRDAADERRVIVDILPKGIAIKEPLREVRNRTASAFALDPANVAILRRGIKKLSRDISIY
jgi:DNA-binding MarR family transcriptional regulator